MAKSKTTKANPASKRAKDVPQDDPYVIDGEDVLRQIEAALKPATRKAWLQRAAQLYPSMEGAKVADVLEMVCHTDSFLPLVEPYLAGTGAAIGEELKFPPIVVGAAARAAIVVGAADFEPRAEAILRGLADGEGKVSFDV